MIKQSLAKFKHWNINRLISKINKYSFLFQSQNTIRLDYGHNIGYGFQFDEKTWNYMFEQGIELSKSLIYANVEFAEEYFIITGKNEEGITEVISFPIEQLASTGLWLYPSIDLNDELQMVANYYKSTLMVPLVKNRAVILHFNEVIKQPQKASSTIFQR